MNEEYKTTEEYINLILKELPEIIDHFHNVSKYKAVIYEVSSNLEIMDRQRLLIAFEKIMEELKHIYNYTKK